MDEQDKVTRLLSSVVNPVTGKSIFDEDRIMEIHATANATTIKYSRNGMDLNTKKNVESSMLELLKKIYPADCINILSFSQTEANDYNSQEHSCSCGSGGNDGKCNDSKSEENSCASNKEQSMPNPRRVPGIKKIIAVASGKGGVGKTTVAVNLAITLQKQGKKVGLLDADIYGPSVPMFLCAKDDKPQSNEAGKILPLETKGLKFISFGLFINENDPVIWRGPMLGGILNQFLFDVQWGELDYLVVDLPPGTGDMQISLAQNVLVDGVIIVSTPQNVALLDSKKALFMFKKLSIPVLGMVENMSSFICDAGKEYFIFGKDGVKKAADFLNSDFLGEIPLEMKLCEGSDSGIPYMENNDYQGSRVWDAYMNLATKVSSKIGVQEGQL